MLDQNVNEPTPTEPIEEITQPIRRKRPAWVTFVWELVQTIVLAIILFFVIDAFIGRVRVENVSMQPTLHEGEFLLVNKLAYRLGSYQRGDVIIFHYPRDPREDYIKRLIGVPGDHVVIQNSQVIVNGEILDEPYIAAEPAYNNQWTVPDGQLFVLGDNRNQSSDSHIWGFVPFNDVVGKALVIYWPLPDFRLLNQIPTVKAAAP